MLDELIRKKAAAGEFNHLSIIASQSRAGLVYKVAYRGTSSDGHAFAEHVDPVTAIEEALTSKRRIVGVGSNAKKPSGDAVEPEASAPVRKRNTRSQAKPGRR